MDKLPHNTTLKELTDLFLDAYAGEWSGLCEGLTEQQWDLLNVKNELLGLAEKSARLAAYTRARYNGSTHEEAVREQNRVAAQVRKALGYTYPRADINF